jgi:dipeptidyl aminopeptidase/acylaminoacyl peptidase
VGAHLRTALVGTCFVALLVAAPPAHATFPGANGKIAYVQQGTGIETVNPDGSDRKLLLATCCGGVSWSPDGTKIAYGASSDGLDVADADGTNAHEILARPPGRALEYPTWSPDQTKLAFLSFDALCQNDFCGYNELWTVNADGTGAARLPGTSVQNPGPPKWSPDGAWIAFSDAANFNSMYVIRPDGSQKTALAGHALPLSWSPDARKILYYSSALVDLYTIKPDGTGNARLPGWPQGQDASGGASWSPDGSKIVVATPDPTCVQPQCYGSDLFVINADGSGQTNITNTPPANDYGPDWQPIPNRPPDCSGVAASRPVLSTANHRLVPITLDGATDPDGDAVTLSVDGVTQDEPVVGGGDNTSPDAVDQGDGQLRVRAERNPHGDGRVYRIAFTASDGHGGSCSGTATVSVPRKKRKPAVDSAPPSYDSLVR